MAQRDLMTIQELYDELLEFERQAEVEYEERMFQHPRIAERKKVQAAYDRKMEHIVDHKIMLWKTCIREDRCCEFPHPHYDKDITKEISVSGIPHQVRISRILLAEAYNEDLWWVDKCLRGQQVSNLRCTYRTFRCMNPKHWISEITFRDLLGGYRK